MAKTTLRERIDYAREHVAWDAFCLYRQWLGSATVKQLETAVKAGINTDSRHWLSDWDLFLEGWEAARDRYDQTSFHT